MAREIAIDMRIDTTKSVEDLVLVEDSLKDIEDSLKKIGASGTGGLDNELEKLNKLTNESKLTWGEMGKAIEQYQNIALAAGKESPIGQEAIKRASELKQEMDLVTQSVDGLSKKGANLQASLQLAGGVVAGYSAFEAVTASLGVENENLTKTFVKLQAAQTALVSIEQIRATVEKESFLMLKLNAFWTKAVAVSTNLLSKAKLADATATGAATLATKAFSAALIASGIGAIVVLIGLLISNFEGVKKAMSSVVDFIYNIFKPQIDAVIDVLQYFGLVESDLEKQARLNSEAKKKRLAEDTKAVNEEYSKQLEIQQEALRKEKELTNEKVDNINFEIRKRQAAGKDIGDLEKEKLRVLKEAAIKEVEIEQAKVDALKKAIIQQLELRGFTLDQAKSFAKENQALLDQLGIGKNIVDAAYGTSEELEQSKANLEKITQDIEIFNIKASTERKKASDKEFEEFKTREAEKLAMQKASIDEVNKARENSAKLGIMYSEQLTYTEQEMAAHRRKAWAEEQQQKLELAGSVTNSISSIYSSLAETANNIGDQSEKAQEQRAKRQFVINKILGITEAAIDTAKGIVKSVAASPATFGMPFTAFTAGVGAAQIAAIASKQFNYSGASVSKPSTSSAVGSITSGSVSSSNQNQQDNTTDIEQLINGNNQMNNQPVLVVDSYTKVADKQAKIKSLSTI